MTLLFSTRAPGVAMDSENTRKAHSLRLAIFAAALLTVMLALTGCTMPNGARSGVAPELDGASVAKVDTSTAAMPYVIPVSEPKRLRGVHVQDVEDRFGPQAKWIERGRTFSITTWGSGSCPNTPTSIEVISGKLIVVELDLVGPNPVCTMDLRPTSFVLDLPPDVTGRPLTVAFKHTIWVQEDEQGPKTTVLPQFVLE